MATPQGESDHHPTITRFCAQWLAAIYSESNRAESLQCTLARSAAHFARLIWSKRPRRLGARYRVPAAVQMVRSVRSIIGGIREVLRILARQVGRRTAGAVESDHPFCLLSCGEGLCSPLTRIVRGLILNRETNRVDLAHCFILQGVDQQ